MKSHPHFQAKQRVSPHFLAGGGITSFGSRFYNVASREPVHMPECVNARFNTQARVRFCTLITVLSNSHNKARRCCSPVRSLQ